MGMKGKQRQQQKMSIRTVLLIGTVSFFFGIITILLVFLFNIGGVKDMLAAPKDGEVELLAYEVEAQQEGVEIFWATGSELNNDYFRIERSLSGRDYEAVGQLMGAGTSRTARKYSFTDPAPGGGTLYYRLVQRGMNGKERVYGPKMVTLKSGEQVKLEVKTLGPNPFRTDFTFDFDLPLAGDVDIRLLDAQGRVVQQRRTSGYQGINTYRYSAGTSLPNGLYFLVLDDGRHQVMKRLVKGS